jgi:hypothetical protein
MKIAITPTKNGAYVEYDDGENIDRMAYTFDEETLDGAITFLCDITDAFGLIGSRYDKQRIRFKIVHGDKYECDGCEICDEDK